MIPQKKFGRTGHKSSRTIFGAAALSSVTEKEAESTLELLVKYGVNHIDTAAGYGNSELHIGSWMAEHRDKFFLATKTDKRTHREAKEELYRSLDRMKVDHIDLWQMHMLVNPNEWEIAMHSGGAIDAFIEAKEEGLTRFLGVTGHGLAAPSVHLQSLEIHDFDSVLLPCNFLMMQNPDYSTAFDKLLKTCAERNVAVQTIKSLAKGPLINKPGHHAVWYAPLEEDEAIKNSVKWVLGNEQIFLNTVGDINLLVKVLEAAEKLDIRPDDDVMNGDLQKYGITPLFTGDEI